MNKNLLRSILIGILIIGAYLLLFNDQPEKKNKISAYVPEQIDRVESNTANPTVDEEAQMLESEISRLNEELKHIASVFPNEPNLSKLLKDLSSIGDSSGLQFLLFEPAEAVNEGVFEEIPIKLKLRGTFKQLAMFFAGLTRMDRMVRIDSLKVTGPLTNSGYVLTETEALLITYRILEGV